MQDANPPQQHLMLQSKEHGDILNVIDELRSLGISHFVSLPQVIVCGDQSSGKSSVLEALSGIQFPRKDNLCTRFATEVILRRGNVKTIQVSIAPDSDRPEQERKTLLDFVRSDVELSQIETVISDATREIGIDYDSKNFASDVLRFEITGPTQPQLTLVDLPGLFSAGSKSQSDDDAEAVRKLVLSYMTNRRSIILAVVSAKNDFANQIVTKYARELDPKGYRTLAIITKPDTLPVGSESEEYFVQLAENRDVVFHHGWHVLKNRDFDTRCSSSGERDEAERNFFSKGIWSRLPTSQTGISSLRPRLSVVLRDQILKELPSLLDDILEGRDSCKKQLERLGPSRGSFQDQQLHLLRISQTFTSLASISIGDSYNDPFFGDAATEVGYMKRLRAVVQNRLLEFSQTMRQEGHAKHIVESYTTEQKTENPRLTREKDFLDDVLLLMKRSRGRELPGTFNPQIIGDLFREQSAPWESLIREYIDTIWEDTVTTVNLILEYASDSNTVAGLKTHIIDPRMDFIKTSIEDKLLEILLQHQKGHPITYNHYFTDQIQNIKFSEKSKTLKDKLDGFFGAKIDEGRTQCNNRNFDVKNLLDALREGTTTDMDRFAGLEAISQMKAYYKVAMKTIVDNVGGLVIENCLLSKLPTLFPPERVLSLDTSTMKDIAAETEESKHERKRTSSKLGVLEESLAVLKKIKHAQPRELLLGDTSRTLDVVEAREDSEEEFETTEPTPDSAPVTPSIQESMSRNSSALLADKLDLGGLEEPEEYYFRSTGKGRNSRRKK